MTGLLWNKILQYTKDLSKFFSLVNNWGTIKILLVQGCACVCAFDFVCMSVCVCFCMSLCCVVCKYSIYLLDKYNMNSLISNVSFLYFFFCSCFLCHLFEVKPVVMLLPIKLSNDAWWYMIFIPSIFGKGNFTLHFAHHLILFDYSIRKIFIVTELLLMLLQIYKHS